MERDLILLSGDVSMAAGVYQTNTVTPRDTRTKHAPGQSEAPTGEISKEKKKKTSLEEASAWRENDLTKILFLFD